MKTKIVWNGCDGYVELDSAKSDLDLKNKMKGNILYTQNGEYKAFIVTEIDRTSVPVDDSGELICDGVYITTSGKFYKAI